MLVENWATQLNQFSIKPNQKTKDWLLKAYHLTRNLSAVCPALKLQVLSHAFMSPSSSEQDALGLAQNKSQVFVRQIFLCDADTALVYGRVTMPVASYTHFSAAIATLGERSIGEQLLYTGNFSRSAFQFSYLNPQHALYQSTVAQLSQPLSVPLWARRSLFQQQDFALLVTEVFLPKLPCYPNPLALVSK